MMLKLYTSKNKKAYNISNVKEDNELLKSIAKDDYISHFYNNIVSYNKQV